MSHDLDFARRELAVVRASAIDEERPDEERHDEERPDSQESGLALDLEHRQPIGFETLGNNSKSIFGSDPVLEGESTHGTR